MRLFERGSKARHTYLPTAHRAWGGREGGIEDKVVYKRDAGKTCQGMEDRFLERSY